MLEGLDVLARLHGTFGPLKDACVMLTQPDLILGREAGVSVVIEHPRVSRRHARLFLVGEKWMIMDLNSTNGVYLNRQRLRPGEPRPVENGDLIQIGRAAAFRFEDANATVSDSCSQLMTPGLWLDPANRRVFVQTQEVELTAQQFALLAFLYAQPDKVFANSEIAEAVWPEARGGITAQAIDNIVHRLNERLAEADQEHKYVVTVRGAGRKFVQR